MNNYEVMFVIDPTLEDDSKAEVIDTVRSIVTDAGGEVGESDVWGLRKLAYPIEKKNEGYYVVLPFRAEPAFPQELDRRLRISDPVMRHIIVNKDAR